MLLRNLFAWIFLSAALVACAVALPVHEAEPPEALGNWGFRIGYFTGTAPLLTAPSGNLATSLSPANDSTTVQGYRVSFGFLDRFQLTTDLFAGLASAGTSLALKYQWTGDTYFKAKAGNFVQSSVVRFWSGGATDLKLDSNFTFQYGDLTGDGEDISHLFGYRFTDWFGVYGGPKMMIGKVKVDYKNSSGGTVQSTDSLDFFGAGGLGGLFISPHGPHVGFDLNLEVEAMNLPKSYESGRTWYSTEMVTLAVPFSFGD